MWYRKRTKKISWTDHMKNKEVLPGVKEDRNILHTITGWLTSSIRTAFYKTLLKES
jgi:hypothetical protein